MEVPLKGYKVTPEDQTAAITWFIERFLHSKFELQHAKRRAGLEALPPHKEWTRQKWRFPQLDFQFLAADDKLLILPNQEAASWAEGVIFLDKNKNYQFITGKPLLSANLPNADLAGK